MGRVAWDKPPRYDRACLFIDAGGPRNYHRLEMPT